MFKDELTSLMKLSISKKPGPREIPLKSSSKDGVIME